MYEVFYKLQAEPFRLSPDHKFCYEHKDYAKARAYMAYAFMRAEGFVMITGRPGTGKTTLIGELVDSLAADNVSTANLVCTQLQADDLLRTVAYSFGIGSAGADKAELLQRMNVLFHSWHRDGRRALLIVDEAQDLSVSAMEELRLLTNIQHEGQPLLQIFLLGQPELRELVLSPEMEQVHQRVVAACHLQGLGPDEIESYVVHRLKRVGWKGDPAISRSIFPLLYKFSEGIPRRINLICSRLFLHGGVEQRHAIEVEDVRVVISELQEENLAAGTRFSPEDFELIQATEWVPVATEAEQLSARPEVHLRAVNDDPPEPSEFKVAPVAAPEAKKKVAEPTGPSEAPRATPAPEATPIPVPPEATPIPAPEATNTPASAPAPAPATAPASAPHGATHRQQAPAVADPVPPAARPEKPIPELPRERDHAEPVLKEPGTSSQSARMSRVEASRRQRDPIAQTTGTRQAEAVRAGSRAPFAWLAAALLALLIAIALWWLYTFEGGLGGDYFAQFSLADEPQPSPPLLAEDIAAAAPVAGSLSSSRSGLDSGAERSARFAAATESVSAMGATEAPVIVPSPESGEGVELADGPDDQGRSVYSAEEPTSLPASDSVDSSLQPAASLPTGEEALESDEVTLLVNFPFDSIALQPDAQEVLAGAARTLRDDRNSSASITGFADPSGDAIYNMNLSWERARAVANYLADTGVDRQRLQVEGGGVLTRSASDSDSSARLEPGQNRVVRIRIERNAQP